MTLTVSLIINAGGQSQRMGQHKALLRLPTGVTLLHHTINQLAPLANEGVIVVTDHREIIAVAEGLPGVRCVPDHYATGGPLGGIASGLRHVTAWAIMVACDMPLIQPAAFQYLRGVAAEAETDRSAWAVVPLIDERPQPFHALYARRCLPVIEQLLAQNERRASSFLSLAPTRWVTAAELQTVDPDLRSLINVNTPNEWQAIYPLLA